MHSVVDKLRILTKCIFSADSGVLSVFQMTKDNTTNKPAVSSVLNLTSGELLSGKWGRVACASATVLLIWMAIYMSGSFMLLFLEAPDCMTQCSITGECCWFSLYGMVQLGFAMLASFLVALIAHLVIRTRRLQFSGLVTGIFLATLLVAPLFSFIPWWMALGVAPVAVVLFFTTYRIALFIANKG